MTEKKDRPRYGNDVFGAFGRDFRTSDGHYLMLVALSPRQWTGLLAALGIEAEIAIIEAETVLDTQSLLVEELNADSDQPHDVGRHDIEECWPATGWNCTHLCV